MQWPTLQQYVPFTVLKLKEKENESIFTTVATVLTVYGIETRLLAQPPTLFSRVATVLTVYGIETLRCFSKRCSFVLQQYLPFTVLKL